MKGYFILVLITAVLLCATPPFLVERSSSPVSTETSLTEEFVLKDDRGEEASYDPTMFALYATLNLLSVDVSDEAIKAVAAAVYTLGKYQFAQGSGNVQAIGEYPTTYAEDYWEDVWGTEVFQIQMPRIKALVNEATKSPICYDGQPIMAAIHAMNNGLTESAAEVWGEPIPYLVSVESTADANDLGCLSTHSIPLEEAAKKLQSLCGEALPPSSEWFGDPITSSVGTVKAMRFGDFVVSGTEIQDVFSLPSAVFTVSLQENQVIFTTQGSGHFVGLSLCGCVAMAENGASWKEILTHYYVGAVI